MKKILVLITLLVLSGCSFKKEKEDPAYLRYRDSLSLIENAPSFVSESEYFSSHLEVSSSDLGYSYYLIIDEPKNAMYNVSIIAVVDGEVYNDDTMAPNFGIFGNDRVNLVPNQVYAEGGYVKGVVINGVNSTDDFTLKALVTWSDESSENTYYEYLMIDSVSEE